MQTCYLILIFTAIFLTALVVYATYANKPTTIEGFRCGLEDSEENFYMNIVRDYNKVQGTYNPADLNYQIIRDIGVRYITIENSSYRPIGVAITTYYGAPPPEVRFIINAGEIKHLAINPQGETAQYIQILNPKTGEPVGNPTILARNANQFVLRDGLDTWFVDKFRRS